MRFLGVFAVFSFLGTGVVVGCSQSDAHPPVELDCKDDPALKPYCVPPQATPGRVGTGGEGGTTDGGATDGPVSDSSSVDESSLGGGDTSSPADSASASGG